VTVPVDVATPATVVGFKVNNASAAAPIVKPACAVAPFALAEIVALTVEETALVFTVKVPELWPNGTTVELGTVADPLLDDRVTTKPDGPARAFNVTCALELAPPITVDGLSVKLTGDAAVIVSVAD